MKTRNPILELGLLEGTVLIFGGPLSNLLATQSLHQRARELSIPDEQIICTGDIVAYGAEPDETVQFVREWGIAIVQGNCEESLGWEAPDCGCGFGEGTVCSRLSLNWYRYANERIGRTDRLWMRRLPKAIRFELNGRSILVVHGGVEQINRYIFPSTPQDIKRAELDLAGTDVVIGGHSGLPWGEKIERRAWLNTGVIGVPANDGTPDGWFLTLQPEGEQTLRCRWHRLSYQAAEAGQSMWEAGLTEYALTLTTGLWPSMDVLPTEERHRRGHPIVLNDLVL